jgi:formate dehydrogenase major subunit
VWWDPELGRWTGHDNPDVGATTAPGYDPPDGAEAERALDGRSPFVMQADGKGWLFVPNGLDDGPLPTHYEPPESPVANPLYGRQTNPLMETYDRPGNRFNPPGSDAYPFVFTTYRLTEHHTAGGMSRTLGYLSELQPEMFCEVSPELARLRGLVNGGWATIVTSRAAIEARVLVTDRIRPLRVAGQVVHQVGLPYHWGSNGLATGDGANDLLPIVGDPNVHIMESKANTCDVLPGRRPRGPALVELVEGHRARALEEGT